MSGGVIVRREDENSIYARFHALSGLGADLMDWSTTLCDKYLAPDTRPQDASCSQQVAGIIILENDVLRHALCHQQGEIGGSRQEHRNRNRPQEMFKKSG